MRLTYGSSMDILFVSPFRQKGLRKYFYLQNLPSLNQMTDHQYGLLINRRSFNALIWLHSLNLQKPGTGTLTVSFHGSPARSVNRLMDRQCLTWVHAWSNFPNFNQCLGWRSTIPIYEAPMGLWFVDCLRGCPFLHYFNCLFNFAPKHLSWKTRFKTIKINTKRLYTPTHPIIKWNSLDNP